MRNLLGRLHARRLPELLRIADAWGVPLHADTKSEVVATLYRAMTDPRTVRDLWDRLTPAERAVAATLADAPEGAAAPTVSELAARLGVTEAEARETALALYRAGLLAREGDDEPLPVGVAPRLLMPREVALNIRRIEDEMAAGDLAQAPLRALVELLDDAELEAAARTWGLRTLPGVARRQELIGHMLRLVNERDRLNRVVAGRSRDAAAIWRIVRGAREPVALSDAAVRSGLGAMDKATAARLRAALAELEGALLIWHAYRGDGTRWLFVPSEIRQPGEAPTATLPSLEVVQLAPQEAPTWRHADAFAWDLLTLLRVLSSPQSPPWEAGQPPPGWLQRAVASRFWYGGHEGVPVGYVELLRELGSAEGILAVDDEARPPRIVSGAQARAWRGLSFGEETARLRERWLQFPRWVEGEPAGIVDVWRADWRGMRPRLLAVLADPDVGLAPGTWVTLESLAARIAARVPTLLGPSFAAATARLGSEAGAGADDEEAHLAALHEVIAFELAGPFVWFGLIQVAHRAGRPRAVSLTPKGVALAANTPPEEQADGDRAPLRIDASGEITLQTPTPEHVWALSSFAEPVDLGPESHYRVTPSSIAAALVLGAELDKIVTFLEHGSRRRLPPELAANLAAWMSLHPRVGLQRALVLRLDDSSDEAALRTALREGGWRFEPHGTRSLLVLLDRAAHDEEGLLALLRAGGHLLRWEDPAVATHGLGERSATAVATADEA